MHQHRIVPLTIALAAGTLSLRLTVRACQALSPDGGAPDVIALGVLWEVSKLYFGPRALVGILPGRVCRLAEGVGNLALLILAVFLTAGSVGASYFFTSQTDDVSRAQAHANAIINLEKSPEYSALLADLAGYAGRIETMRQLAKDQAADRQRTKSVATDAKVDALQEKKDATLAQLAALRAEFDEKAVISRSAKVDHLKGLRSIAHVSIAIALELISIAAFILFHAGAQDLAPYNVHDSRSEDTAITGRRRPSMVAISGGKGGPTARDLRAREQAHSGGANCPPPGIGIEFAQRYTQARSLIERGLIEPSVVMLMRSVQVSQRPAQRFLQALRQEGLIEQRGRRYRRATDLVAVS